MEVSDEDVVQSGGTAEAVHLHDHCFPEMQEGSCVVWLVVTVALAIMSSVLSRLILLHGM